MKGEDAFQVEGQGKGASGPVVSFRLGTRTIPWLIVYSAKYTVTSGIMNVHNIGRKRDILCGKLNAQGWDTSLSNSVLASGCINTSVVPSCSGWKFSPSERPVYVGLGRIKKKATEVPKESTERTFNPMRTPSGFTIHHANAPQRPAAPVPPENQPTHSVVT